MKWNYLFMLLLSCFLVIACDGEPSQTEERIPSHKVSPNADVTTTTVPDNIDDPAETIPPVPDSLKGKQMLQ